MLTAHWRYSGACNFNCRFCFAFPQDLLRQDVDEFSIIDKLAEAGFTHVVFGGDEPLMRKQDLLRLIPYAASRGLACGLDTNGSLADDETLHVLKQNKVLLGLPIYSSERRTHDEVIERKGHYDLVLALLEKCAHAGIPVRVQTAVTAKNKNSIIDIGKLCEKYGVLYWNLIRFRAYRQALLHKQEYSVSEAEFVRLVEKTRSAHPRVNIVARGGDHDADCAYFIIQRDGRVVSPAEDGSELVLGDLTTQNCRELMKKIDVIKNEKKTLIESIRHNGDVG